MFWAKLLMNKNTFHILVVDDDDKIRELIKEYLIKNNFLVTTAKDAFDAKKKLEIVKFDILILDIMMPGESGLSLTKEIKKNYPTPIILLTAKSEIHDRIKGLELGADDYLGKPFEPKELTLRIKNILNKTQKPTLSDEVYIGNALIDLKKLNIKINNKIKKINPQEKKTLEKMLESPGKVFSRNDIGKIINISKERTIDVMITRLRQKIESSPKNPKYLQTVRGSGYVLWIK
jgi:two-component system phosphate regulon response regulator OmpR